MKLKKGDNVIVIAGKDKSKKGKITRVLSENDQVVVEAINLAKRRVKPRRSGEKGQMVEVASPLHWAKVMLFCAHCKQGVRFRQGLKKDKKIRLCVRCNKEI